MVDSIEAAGLRFVGKDETGRRMEVFLNSLHVNTQRGLFAISSDLALGS
jgi:hypothetical protein